ncbi:MAG: hypothetical protein QXP36_00410 [Conexivisphaerales archaeon]
MEIEWKNYRIIKDGDKVVTLKDGQDSNFLCAGDIAEVDALYVDDNYKAYLNKVLKEDYSKVVDVSNGPLGFTKITALFLNSFFPNVQLFVKDEIEGFQCRFIPFTHLDSGRTGREYWYVDIPPMNSVANGYYKSLSYLLFKTKIPFLFAPFNDFIYAVPGNPTKNSKTNKGFNVFSLGIFAPFVYPSFSSNADFNFISLGIQKDSKFILQGKEVMLDEILSRSHINLSSGNIFIYADKENDLLFLVLYNQIFTNKHAVVTLSYSDFLDGKIQVVSSNEYKGRIDNYIQNIMRYFLLPEVAFYKTFNRYIENSFKEPLMFYPFFEKGVKEYTGPFHFSFIADYSAVADVVPVGLFAYRWKDMLIYIGPRAFSPDVFAHYDTIEIVIIDPFSPYGYSLGTHLDDRTSYNFFATPIFDSNDDVKIYALNVFGLLYYHFSYKQLKNINKITNVFKNVSGNIYGFKFAIDDNLVSLIRRKERKALNYSPISIADEETVYYLNTESIMGVRQYFYDKIIGRGREVEHERT